VLLGFGRGAHALGLHGAWLYVFVIGGTVVVSVVAFVVACWHADKQRAATDAVTPDRSPAMTSESRYR